MPYTLNHSCVSQNLGLSISHQGDQATVHCSASGTMDVRFPGKLRIVGWAHYQIWIDTGDDSGNGGPVHGHRTFQTKTLPLTVTIKTPDGQPFTANHVTLADLARFRDLRGTSQGSWSWSVHGQSQPILVEAGSSGVTAHDDGYFTLTLEETVPSQSAPPLVHETLGSTAHRVYHFDLYRVGTFLATANLDSFAALISGGRTMKLFDPDGVEVASSNNGHLTFPVPLEVLDKSRDAHGNVRTWSLEVFPSFSPIGAFPANIWASVIATARIRTETLQSRIDTLLGAGASKLSIYGEMDAVKARLLARLKILDEYTAETIDLYQFLDSVLKKVPQDNGVSVTDIKANVA